MTWLDQLALPGENRDPEHLRHLFQGFPICSSGVWCSIMCEWNKKLHSNGPETCKKQQAPSIVQRLNDHSMDATGSLIIHKAQFRWVVHAWAAMADRIAAAAIRTQTAVDFCSVEALSSGHNDGDSLLCLKLDSAASLSSSVCSS